MTNSRTRILRSTQNGHFWEVYVKHYTLKRRRRKSHSPHGQTVRFLRLETALKSGPPPSMAEMHRKVRHSKTSAECKTAARPQQSRCSTQPEGLMRSQCDSERQKPHPRYIPTVAHIGPVLRGLDRFYACSVLTPSLDPSPDRHP